MKKKGMLVVLVIAMLLSVISVGEQCKAETVADFTKESHGCKYEFKAGTLTVTGSGKAWSLPSEEDQQAVKKLLLKVM